MFSTAINAKRIIKNVAQRRYRDRQREKEEILEARNSYLRSQCYALKLHRDMLNDIILLRQQRRQDSRFYVLKTYAELFQRGVSTDTSENSLKQENFVYSIFHPKVIHQDEENIGPETILYQWRMHTILYDCLKVSFDSIQWNDTENYNVVTLTLTIEVRISRNTMKVMFPHLLMHEEIIQKLIGRCLDVTLHQTFYFENDQVVYLGIEHDSIRQLTCTLYDVIQTNTIFDCYHSMMLRQGLVEPYMDNPID